MKEGWQIKTLGEICDKGSSNVSQNQLEDDSGKYPIFGASGLIKNISFYQQDKEYVSIIKDGAGIGRIELLPAYSSVIGTLQYLIPKDNIDAHFFYYLLMSIDFNKYKNGSTIPHIYFKDYAEEPVSIPSLSEQKRIVCIFDEAFKDIAKTKNNTEKNLRNARELYDIYLNSILFQKTKCERKTLNEVTIEFSRGKSKHRPRGDKSLQGGKYPFIQTGDIANARHHITKHSQTYNEKGLKQSKLWPCGTICIAIVGANVGECAILNFDSCFPDSVIGLIVNNKYAYPDYVYYLLSASKLMLKEKGKGTARDNINMGTFEKLTFPFPDIKTQKTIVENISILNLNIKRLESIYLQKQIILNELKKSIFHQAFSGQL